MNDRKQISDWYLAFIHYANSVLLMGLVVILLMFGGGAVIAMLFFADNTDVVMNFVDSRVGLDIAAIISFVFIYFGTASSAKRISKKYVVKNAENVLKIGVLLQITMLSISIISTIVSSLGIFGLEFSTILELNDMTFTEQIFNTLSEAVVIWIFYTQSTKYLKNNA